PEAHHHIHGDGAEKGLADQPDLHPAEIEEAEGGADGGDDEDLAKRPAVLRVHDGPLQALGLLADTVRSRATWPAGGPKLRKASLNVANTGPASPLSLVQKFLALSKTPDCLRKSMQP